MGESGKTVERVFEQQNSCVDLGELQESLRKIFRYASVIVAGRSVHIVYDCVDGDVIDETVEGTSELEAFRSAIAGAESVELAFSQKGGRFRGDRTLTYGAGVGGMAAVCVLEPMERRPMFRDRLAALKETPPRSESGIERYRVSNELLCHPNDEKYIRKELEKIFEWFDSRAEKRTMVNLPALARWRVLCELIGAVPEGLETEALEPYTIEDMNRASAAWYFEGEGEYSFSVRLDAECRKTFVRMLELADDFLLEIGYNDGYSGIGYTFGINDVMM